MLILMLSLKGSKVTITVQYDDNNSYFTTTSLQTFQTQRKFSSGQVIQYELYLKRYS